MKKRGIVLLITLFFITAISIVIFKNLEDTDSFIDQLSFDTNLMQADILNQNIKSEVIRFTNKLDTNSLDTLLEFAAGGIPFEFGNSQIILTLHEYFPQNYCDLHSLVKANGEVIDSSTLSNQCDDNVTENVLHPYRFIEFAKNYEPKTKAQLNYMINEYKNETLDTQIDTVTEKFRYHTFEIDSEKRYIDCTYEVFLDGLVLDGELIFQLGKEEPEFFDFNLRVP